TFPAFPFINYATHPAFRDFPRPGGVDPPVIDGWLAVIDRNFAELCAAARPLSLQEIQDAFAQMIDPSFSALLAECAARLGDNRVTSAAVTHALNRTRNELHREVIYRNQGLRFKGPRRPSAVAEKVAANLDADGVSLCRLPDRITNELYE